MGASSRHGEWNVVERSNLPYPGKLGDRFPSVAMTRVKAIAMTTVQSLRMERSGMKQSRRSRKEQRSLPFGRHDIFSVMASGTQWSEAISTLSEGVAIASLRSP
ncbi:MAG: hypothetical protein J7524_20020 [Roseofilum sp. Belize BBD 4]|uniref:hypothetical protein n=1 Tax=Roseofilum sp. Belize BBD 4 TaxID=2821500 RepID=UPI001B215B39|nr:hypothetical protein [Roseofilum sp. Belize BBD 4]MBP0035426.1 hypothetical protein [Roseofilum sp. Belize BBD 4]